MRQSTEVVGIGDRPGEPTIATPQWPSRESVRLYRAVSVLLVVAAAGLLVWARYPWEYVEFTAAGLGAIAIGAQWFVEPVAFTSGAARIAADPHVVRFVARPLGQRLLVCASLVFVLLGAAILLMLWSMAIAADPTTGIAAISFRSYALPLFGALCAVILVRTAVRARRVARGLTVDHLGVVAAWNGTVQCVAWDDMLSAGSGEGKMLGPTLWVLGHGARDDINVLTSVTGSDPAVLAAFVNHFRDHPADRALLSQPELAWERFRASFAPGAGDTQP